jgi:hypothetical protein
MAPKLVFARQNGQTSVLVIFDQEMRELGASAPEDPQNPSLWTLSGGLPTVVSVTRLSAVEFELHLSAPMPLGAGYSVTVGLTTESMVGEKVDPSGISQTFDVVTPDFRLTTLSWNSKTELDLVFSEALTTIQFDAFHDVLFFEPKDLDARQTPVIGLTQSGSTMRVTLDAAGTAGARYTLRLNRQVFQALATSTTLKLGDEEQTVYGQGDQPTVVSFTATETAAEVTSSEVLGEQGWPLFPGAYTISTGSLGPDVTSTSPSVALFDSAQFTIGDTVEFSVARTKRQLTAGVSLASQATSVIGAGSESIGVNTTTLNKTSGDPYELVFSGGVDSIIKAGRALETTLAINFTPSSSVYPLLAFTFLNTQVSIVISKTADNLATLRLYRGHLPVTPESAPFDPSTPFNFDVIDATGDHDGYLAVAIDGSVLVGAPAGNLFDPVLFDASIGATAIAAVLGSPVAPTATFSVTFSQPIVTQTFLATGFLGVDSGDLLSFSESIAEATVAASPTAPSGGFNNTGKPAFGVYAQYAEEVDAIQVVVGLNDDAVARSFTGTISLMTANEEVMDQVPFDRGYMLVGSAEVVSTFLHPKQWAGLLIGVTIEIDGNTYSVKVPLTIVGMPPISAQLTQQPASWYHPRLSPAVDLTGAGGFGPTASILTP